MFHFHPLDPFERGTPKATPTHQKPCSTAKKNRYYLFYVKILFWLVCLRKYICSISCLILCQHTLKLDQCYWTSISFSSVFVLTSDDDDDDGHFETCKWLHGAAVLTWITQINILSLHLQVLLQVKTPSTKPKKMSDDVSEDRWGFFIFFIIWIICMWVIFKSLVFHS